LRGIGTSVKKVVLREGSGEKEKKKKQTRKRKSNFFGGWKTANIWRVQIKKAGGTRVKKKGGI